MIDFVQNEEYKWALSTWKMGLGTVSKYCILHFEQAKPNLHVWSADVVVHEW